MGSHWPWLLHLISMDATLVEKLPLPRQLTTTDVAYVVSLLLML